MPSLSQHFLSDYSITNWGLRIEVPFLRDNDIVLRPVIPSSSTIPTEYASIVVPITCSLGGERLAMNLGLSDGSEDQFHRRPGQTLMYMTELYRHM